ncbi:MAG: STAS domain-containing protein [Nocardioides sp.]|nr:STAS domain-containing protein [Nocardioides sp.]
MDAGLKITDEGQCLVLCGDFYGHSTREARDAIYHHLATTQGDVRIDCAEVEAVDLNALRLLAVATRQAHAEGRRMVLCGCRPSVRRMLHLSRLYRLLEVEGSPLVA